MVTFAVLSQAQTPLRLDLKQTIRLANDSSLEALRTQNIYLAKYWEYRAFKANRLPSLTLNLTPAEYNRNITKRYDFQKNLDVYRMQRSFFSGGGLSIKQNFDITGGTFYLDSKLDYLRNFGDVKTTQYTSIPFRIGYYQELLGYNAFKWERRIEPLKYEKARKELVYNIECISEQAITYFFTLALAQAEYKLAKNNLVSTDTLYAIGEQRYQIAAISKADLLTLKLDLVNARNTIQNKFNQQKRAMFSLASFLHLNKETIIELDLPERPNNLIISTNEALQWCKLNNPLLIEEKQKIWEAERNVHKTKCEARFNASINASVGFNQAADNFGSVYRHPMRQDLVSISVSIPLVDWGVRKGKYNMAKNNLNVAQISAQQQEVTIEEELVMTVREFNSQQQLMKSASEALDLSILAYEQTRQRFIIGKTDVNSLTLALNRQQQAQQNYIQALQKYWQHYYKIRRLTLYDFQQKMSLVNE